MHRRKRLFLIFKNQDRTHSIRATPYSIFGVNYFLRAESMDRSYHFPERAERAGDCRHSTKQSRARAVFLVAFLVKMKRSLALTKAK